MTMYWQSTAIATRPPSTVQASTEDIPYGIDMAAYLEDGEAIDPDTIEAQLVPVGGAAVDLDHAPTLAGTVITQRVTGLSAGITYQLIVTFTVEGSTKRLSTVTAIRCDL